MLTEIDRLIDEFDSIDMNNLVYGNLDLIALEAEINEQFAEFNDYNAVNTRRVYIPRCAECGAPMQASECIECGERNG